jgi:hypothetical protein
MKSRKSGRRQYSPNKLRVQLQAERETMNACERFAYWP